jgi:hypothetical protein
MNYKCVCGNEKLIAISRMNPAINLEDLVSGPGDVCCQMQKHCNRANWKSNDSEGIQYVRTLEKNGATARFANPPSELVVLAEGQLQMRLSVRKQDEVDPKGLQDEIAPQFARGAIIEGDAW